MKLLTLTLKWGFRCHKVMTVTNSYRNYRLIFLVYVTVSYWTPFSSVSNIRRKRKHLTDADCNSTFALLFNLIKSSNHHYFNPNHHQFCAWLNKKLRLMRRAFFFLFVAKIMFVFWKKQNKNICLHDFPNINTGYGEIVRVSAVESSVEAASPLPPSGSFPTRYSAVSPWRCSSWADTAPAGRTTSSCTPWTEPRASPRGSASPERPGRERWRGHRPPSHPRLSPRRVCFRRRHRQGDKPVRKLRDASKRLTPHSSFVKWVKRTRGGMGCHSCASRLRRHRCESRGRLSSRQWLRKKLEISSERARKTRPQPREFEVTRSHRESACTVPKIFYGGQEALLRRHVE